jgi:hypothetical protein
MDYRKLLRKKKHSHSKLSSANAYYHSIPTILSLYILSKNVKLKCKIYSFLSFCMGVKFGLSH